MTGSPHARRVLLVEDEMIVAYLLHDMLACLGCTVVGPAARVHEALDLLATETIDAAVLDINLNGELSYPVADVLVARGIPFLFSTGYDRESVREGYRAHPYLQKPYSASELECALAGLFPVGPLTVLAA